MRYLASNDPLRRLRLRVWNSAPVEGFHFAAGGREARAMARRLMESRRVPVDVIAPSGRVLVTLRPTSNAGE